MLVYTNSGLYLYVDNQLKQISSEFNTKYPCTSYLYYFTKIAENTYYIYGYYGLYKINLEDYSFTSLSSNVGNWYIDNFDINNYKIIVSQKYYYIINTETGEVSTLEVGHGTLQSFVKLEYKDYVIFYSKYDSYLYYFNTTTNTYGRIKAGWNYMFMSPQVMIKADKVYILDELGFYVLDINDLSPNEPLVYFNNIDSSMSSLTRGEIYSKVGTLDGSNLYVKYILQEDGTFVKELVII